MLTPCPVLAELRATERAADSFRRQLRSYRLASQRCAECPEPCQRATDYAGLINTAIAEITEEWDLCQPTRS